MDALEMGARKYPQTSGGFLQVSGLTYTIDAAVPSSVVVDENGAFQSVDGPRRVTGVKVGGQPLELDRVYTLASHNYMLSIKKGQTHYNVRPSFISRYPAHLLRLLFLAVCRLSRIRRFHFVLLLTAVPEYKVFSVVRSPRIVPD